MHRCTKGQEMAKRPDRVTLSIPVELKTKARAQAILRHKDLSQVVRELLTMWLEGKIELPELEENEPES